MGQQLYWYVNIGTAIRSAGQVLLERPASLLPVYLLVLGITAVTRVPILVGIAVAIGLLVADGRLEALFEAIEAVDFEALEETGAEGDVDPDAIPTELETAVLDVLSVEIAAILSLAVMLAVVVSIVSNGISNAAAINGVYGCLYDGDGVADAVVGVGRDWKAFVGIVLVQIAIVLVGIVPLGIGVSLVVVSPVAGIAATLIGGLLSATLILGGLLAVAFAGQSIVVEGTTLGGAIRRSAGFPVREPLSFLAYVLVALGVFGSLAVLGALFGVLGVSQLTGIISPLVAIPFVDAFKTALYAERPFVSRSVQTQREPSAVVTDGGSDRPDGDEAETDASEREDEAETDASKRESDAGDTQTGASEPDTDSEHTAPNEPAAGILEDESQPQSGQQPQSERHSPAYRHQFVAAFRDGLKAVGEFTRGQPGSMLAATVLFVAAAAAGWLVTAEFAIDLPTDEGVGEVFGTIPIGAFVMIAANNWLVSATAVFGGVALGVPTAVDMLLNGFIIGLVAGVVEPIVFLALVGPHGIIEVPAILIAGGLGLHVGMTVAGVLRGTQSSFDLAEVLRLAYRVLLGLAIILIVAAFVEAFLTPPIAEFVLS